MKNLIIILLAFCLSSCNCNIKSNSFVVSEISTLRGSTKVLYTINPYNDKMFNLEGDPGEFQIGDTLKLVKK